MPPPGFAAALQRRMAAAAAAASAAAGQGGDGHPRSGKSGQRGVTLHKRTKRFEGHIWTDKKQVYLGAYDVPEQAGCAHDIMALKTKPSVRPEDLNFAPSSYAELEPFLQQMAQAEVVSALRDFSKSTAARIASSAAPAARTRKRPAPASSATVSISSSTQEGPEAGGGDGAGGGNAVTSSQRPAGLWAGPGSLRRASKRKCPTPTASVTDLESMERTLLIQQAQQAQQAQRAQHVQQVQQVQQRGLPPLPPPPPQQPRHHDWQQQTDHAAAAAAVAAAAAAQSFQAGSAGGNGGGSVFLPWRGTAMHGSSIAEQATSSGVLLWPPGMWQHSPPGTTSSSPTHQEQSSPAERVVPGGLVSPPLAPPPLQGFSQQQTGDPSLAAAAAALTAGLWQAPAYSPLKIKPLHDAPASIPPLPEGSALPEGLLLPAAVAGSEAGWGGPGGGLLTASNPSNAAGATLQQQPAPPPPYLPTPLQRSPWAVINSGEIANSSSGSPFSGLLPAHLQWLRPEPAPAAWAGAGQQTAAGPAAEAGLPPDTPMLTFYSQVQPPRQPQPLLPTLPAPAAAAQHAAAQLASLPLLSPAVATRAVQELANIQLAAELFGPRPPF